MKHSIRQHIINAQGFKTTKVIKVEGELGSGILDKNGREIFEGDTVKYKDKIGFVTFYRGVFNVESSQLYNTLNGCNLDGALEVVGHAED